MDSTTQSTNDNRGTGKNKRKWTELEDEKLIDALLDLVNVGTHKADNGFKPGFSTVIENALKEKLPGSGIKAKPHIESRMKTLKKDFSAIHDMLHGSTSGFGWNIQKKCVDADNKVWDGYLKSHPKAVVWKRRTFPHYEDLCTIFGKDQAMGKDAKTPADALEELEREDTTSHGMEGEDIMNMDLSSARSEESSSHKMSKKRSRSSANSLTESITGAAMIIRAEIREATEKFSKVIGVEFETVGMIRKVNEVISNIPDITMKERHKAARLIARDQETIVLFFFIPNEEKGEWVKALLSGDI